MCQYAVKVTIGTDKSILGKKRFTDLGLAQLEKASVFKQIDTHLILGRFEVEVVSV